MKKEQYKDTFKKMLIAADMKKKWVQKQMKMSKIEFYRAVHNDTLSPYQKQRIAKLLSV